MTSDIEAQTMSPGILPDLKSPRPSLRRSNRLHLGEVFFQWTHPFRTAVLRPAALHGPTEASAANACSARLGETAPESFPNALAGQRRRFTLPMRSPATEAARPPRATVTRKIWEPSTPMPDGPQHSRNCIQAHNPSPRPRRARRGRTQTGRNGGNM